MLTEKVIIEGVLKVESTFEGRFNLGDGSFVETKCPESLVIDVGGTAKCAVPNGIFTDLGDLLAGVTQTLKGRRKTLVDDLVTHINLEITN